LPSEPKEKGTMTGHIGDLPHAIDDGEELDRHLAGRRPAVFLDYDLGCWELRSMGLVDISRRCETCHSAERYSWGASLGPCRARGPDGRQTFVCCASKKQLLGGDP
jgi:hypothetical protein